MRLDGMKALVFGGTSGIGLACCWQLKKLGVSVVALSRDPSKATAEAAEAFTLTACNVLDREALAAVCAAEAPYDILVSTATGGERAFGPFLGMGLDGYRGSFDKLWGYANVVQLGAPHLTPTGAIVLVSGTPARRPKPGQVALASVGAAVEQMARSVARELAPRRITVVSPGIIETPLFGSEGGERTAKLAGSTAGNVIPRPGEPDEVAKAIIFAIENDFVTGTTIDVDGGWLCP